MKRSGLDRIDSRAFISTNLIYRLLFPLVIGARWGGVVVGWNDAPRPWVLDRAIWIFGLGRRIPNLKSPLDFTRKARRQMRELFQSSVGLLIMRIPSKISRNPLFPHLNFLAFSALGPIVPLHTSASPSTYITSINSFGSSTTHLTSLNIPCHPHLQKLPRCKVKRSQR